jgi:hypothetical protein
MTKRNGQSPPPTLEADAPGLDAAGLQVVGLVRADGSPASLEDLGDVRLEGPAPAPRSPTPGTITITVTDSEAFLAAFAGLFGYQEQVRDVANPAAVIPNPQSKGDFAVAVIRAYVAKVIDLANQNEGGNP